MGFFTLELLNRLNFMLRSYQKIHLPNSFKSFVWLLVLPVLCFFGSTQIIAQTYTDVAGIQGVSAIPNSLQYGSGMSFYDFNKDGWDDLSFAMVDDSCVFYINQQGTFEQVTSRSWGQTCKPEP